MRMYNPPHPGLSIKKGYMEPLGLTLKDLAEGLGVAKSTIDRVIKGKTSITTDMAIRLSVCFSTSAEMWLSKQRDFDLWQAEKKNAKRYKKVRVLWRGLEELQQAG